MMKKFLLVPSAIFLAGTSVGFMHAGPLGLSQDPIANSQQAESQNLYPTVTSAAIPNRAEGIFSPMFTYTVKRGDKVGAMVVDTVGPAVDVFGSNGTTQASADNLHVEFTGTITLVGTVSAPTGNLKADIGMGPEYSLSDLTPDSLAKLPSLQGDVRDVFLGIKNTDIMKHASVANGDTVEITIRRLYYTFLPATVWNEIDVVSVKKMY